jgi:hypothetical protein
VWNFGISALRVSGFRESRGRVAWSHNSRNREKEKAERWVLSICQRVRATEVKGVVKLRGKSRKTFDLAKGGKFQKPGNHKGRGTSVGRSLKSRKDEISGNKRRVFGALKESTLIDVSGFGG